jgi:hypothetical protein
MLCHVNYNRYTAVVHCTVLHNAYCKHSQHYSTLLYCIYNTNLLQACCVHPLCASQVVLLELLPVLLLLMVGVAVTAA